ncbi:putative reverse transcriptase domain-containing protein [Tanacetum coccineum]
MSKVLQERGFGSLPISTEANLRDQVKSISTTIKANSYPIRHIRSSKYAVSTGQNHTLMTVKYPKGIAKNMLVGIGKFVFLVDFIILDMLEDIKVRLILERPFLSTAHAKIDAFKQKITLRIGEERITFKSVKPAIETLVINRSLDPLNGYYIELNDLNEPFELRRNQGDDLMPTIEEGKVIEKFRSRNDEIDIGIDDYPILEDMEAYCDDGMGDVIFGEPFLKEVGIKARRFEGMITIYNDNESVSDEDKKNGISRSYQKLKGFYKGVLNLGPDYIRDAKIEEWLTRGHISVHEME